MHCRFLHCKYQANITLIQIGHVTNKYLVTFLIEDICMPPLRSRYGEQE